MDTTTILILAAACLILGVVLDNLVHLLLKKEPKPEDAQATPAEPPAEPLKAAPAPSQPAGLEEVARLWDENDTHILVVEVAGQQFHQARELTSERRAQLELTLERLSNWLRKPLQTPLSPLPDRPAADSPVETTPPVASPSASDINAAGQLAPAPNHLPPIKKVSLNPVDVVAKAFQADIVVPIVSKSLAEQVDEILQEKLFESPLREKKIRLLDLPGGGLVVMVGLEKYDGIDAVPDEQVRALLREAVDEWGRRAIRR